MVLVFANECYAACSNAENKLSSECGTCCSPNATPSQCATGDTCTQSGNFAYCRAPTTPDPCAGECDDSANPCAGRTGQTSTCEVNQADANKCRHCTYVCDTSSNYCAFGSSDCVSTLGLACQQQMNSPYYSQCTCTLTGWCTDSNACTTAPNTECVRVNTGQPCRDEECKGDSECTGGLTGKQEHVLDKPQWDVKNVNILQHVTQQLVLIVKLQIIVRYLQTHNVYLVPIVNVVYVWIHVEMQNVQVK